MKKLFKEWRDYLVSMKINEVQTVTMPNVRMTSPDLGTPGDRPDPLRWRDHLKRQYPEEYKKLNDELKRRFSKHPGLGPEASRYSAATKSKLIKNNIIDYWSNAMRGLETGAPIKLPKTGFFQPASGKPLKPWPSPEDFPSGRPSPTQSPSGRVYDYPAATPEGPPKGFKEPFPKKAPKVPKVSVLKALGPAGAALATVDGIDSLVGPEFRKAIATLTGASKEEVAQIPTPTLKQRLKTLVSTYAAPFEMGAEFLRSKLSPTEQEKRAAEFQRRIEDEKAARRWAELAGHDVTGGDVSGVVKGKKKP